MKRFVLLALATLAANCLVASGHGSHETDSYAEATTGYGQNYESGFSKGAIIDGAKSIIQKKVDAIKNAAAYKASLVHKVAEKYQQLEDAKQAIINNYIEAKKAKLQKTIDALKQKTSTLFDYASPVKDKVTHLFNGAVTKVKSEIERKKELLSLIKNNHGGYVYFPSNGLFGAPSIADKPSITQIFIPSKPETQTVPSSTWAPPPSVSTWSPPTNNYEHTSNGYVPLPSEQTYVPIDGTYGPTSYHQLPPGAYQVAENNYGTQIDLQEGTYTEQNPSDVTGTVIYSA